MVRLDGRELTERELEMADQIDHTIEFAKVENGKVVRAYVMENVPLGDRYSLTFAGETMHDIDSYWLDFKLKTLGFDPTTGSIVAEYCEDHQTYHRI